MVRTDGQITNITDRLNIHPGRCCVTKNRIECLGENFEAMQITPSGTVWIWTAQGVLGLNFEANLEKLLWLPRNPPAVSAGEAADHKLDSDEK